MMIYDNSTIRRQDRLLCETEAMELLKNGEYGFLAMASKEGGGYGLPFSYAFDGESIYLHCAPEGEKIDALRQNNRVSFCVVGKTEVVPAKFTTAYKSVLVTGTVAFLQSDEEKMSALKLILEKYSSDFMEMGEKYAKGSLSRTYVLKLTIERVSGKCKK